MKVIAINGSPRPEGNTSCALRLVFEELNREGVETESIQIGNRPVRSCLACGACRITGDGTCALGDDCLNDAAAKIRAADGLILASPVHFSGMSGAMKCFCDRLGYIAGSDKSLMRHKVGAALVAVRRTGGSATLDSLLHYLTYQEMLIASSNYWTVIHGMTPGEALRDSEGEQIMRLLGKNMAWMLKMRSAGLSEAPETVAKISMNYIR